ncbi:MAG TPA: hypothetical protein VFE54_07050 [Mucilaginibacter sp.]|nr:hypothetical protein [Mucilaginibacter sp.]
MKTPILLLITLLTLAACKKEAMVVPKAAPLKFANVADIKKDTIPEGAAFKIKLVKDDANYDETMFIFHKTSTLAFDFNEDAAYFPGYGAESLSSISSDGQDLAIYNLPYRNNLAIGLDVNMQTDGAYSFVISYERKIPANIQVWVKDNYTNNSFDVSSKNYTFNVVKADTNSFGNKRFKLVIKNSDIQ